MRYPCKKQSDPFPTSKPAPKFEWKQSSVHKHEWQTIERWSYDGLWKFHVCVTDHKQPIIEPFDFIAGLTRAEERLLGAG